MSRRWSRSQYFSQADLVSSMSHRQDIEAEHLRNLIERILTWQKELMLLLNDVLKELASSDRRPRTRDLPAGRSTTRKLRLARDPEQE